MVGVCSTSVRAMGLASTSLGDWVANAATAFNFAPGLEPVPRKPLKRRIAEQLRELVHPHHEPPPVERLPHAMKEIERDRRAQRRTLEKLGDIEAHDGAVRQPFLTARLGAVEHPRVLAIGGFTPAREACVHALRVRGIQELDEPRQPSRRRRLQRQRAEQRLLEIRFLADGEG